jgi:hypothetical protein
MAKISELCCLVTNRNISPLAHNLGEFHFNHAIIPIYVAHHYNYCLRPQRHLGRG